jgi:hypothetical protein
MEGPFTRKRATDVRAPFRVTQTHTLGNRARAHAFAYRQF